MTLAKAFAEEAGPPAQGGAPVVLEALPPAGLAYLLATERPAPLLVVVAATDDRAEALARDLQAFGVEDVELFAAEAHTPFDAAAPDADIGFAQTVLRHRLLHGDRPATLVVPVAALQLRWGPDADFLAATANFRVGDDIPLEQTVALLLRCGYNRVPFVEDPGTFAVRGSIVDVFAPDRPRPVRLDFFGDSLESIKAFDPDTQRTYEPEPAMALHPLREVVFTDASVARARSALEHLAELQEVPTRKMREISEEIEQRNYFYGVEALWPLFYEGGHAAADLLLGADAVVVLDDAAEVDAALDARDRRTAYERERALTQHRLALPAADLVEPAPAVRERLATHRQVHSVPLVTDRRQAVAETGLRPWTDISQALELRRRDATQGEILDPVAAEIRARVDRRQELFLVCSTRGNAERLRELLLARKLDLPLLEALPAASSYGEARRHPRVAVVTASLTAGLIDETRAVAFLTDVEIFGTPPRTRRRRRQPAAADGLSTLRDLREGDGVIHVDHGIGRYLGLKRLVLGGVDGDYVHLEYAGGDKLYLPIYRLNVLQRYQGAAGEELKLDKLGGTRWERTKQRVRDAVLAIAHQLLALQAKRNAQPGFALAGPDEHFRAFEATFVYDETEDQRRAIQDVLSDLQKQRPMDRLVCGDVGFGKTEVAIRAAFLAVLAKKQVAVLVPTTVLAEQHGITFRERLAGEAVTVEVLSRFRTKAETDDILGRVRRGAVDVLVGTHRMLSADVVFEDLGLLVIDEEHRFGVKHKERIKELRALVHVLTLTATPIPRTMHMAMIGLRDLSIIATPPPERTAIRTEVTVFDEEVIAEAIRRELHRGGQVFVVHNRVQTLPPIVELLQELVPEARLAVAHGQMTGPQLEKIMVDFIRRDTNVLVCTAIIESGIDIPSANTMIVNRADTFGLAQLHQLRGRIGRARERAYAYLLLPRGEKITREATERLAVLKRFSDLGAGFQIASQDLDLRGAGNLLGAEQSGNMAAVGLELYTELLGEAVEKAKGQRAHNDIEPDIKLQVSAVLPEAYVPDPVRRLGYYQRMAQAESDERVFDIASEIEDVYGRAPDEVHHLAEVMVIRRRLKKLGATALSGAHEGTTIRLGVTFLPDAPLDRTALAARILAEPQRYRLTPQGKLVITADTLSDTTPIELLRRVRHELGQL